MSARKLLLFLCILGLLAGALSLALGGPLPAVSVLEKDGNPKTNPMPQPPYIKLLQDQGIILGYPDAGKQVPLSWEAMKKYNVTVVIRPPDQAGYAVLTPEELKEQRDLLDRYLEAGGGVLVFAGVHVGDGYNDNKQLNEWLKPYGIQLGWQFIADDAHTYKNPPSVPWQRAEYLWTTNITEAPIAAGVKTLFFPHDRFWVPSIQPLRISSPTWQVIVSSMPTTQTWDLSVPLGGQVPEPVAATVKTGAAALIAVRQVGKGRLCVCGPQASALWYDLGKPVGAQVASVKGDGQTPSDWLPLLRNLCVWLSEPARAANFPGGATEPVQTFVNPEYGNLKPIDWNRLDVSWPDSEIYRLYAIHAGEWDVNCWRENAAGYWKSYKFLVGAHTRATGGHGTVADWKKAALRAGFSGVIFREQILQMTEQQWNDFEAECKAASDDHFLAIPGQEYTDWIGQRFMRYSMHLPYFHVARLTADHKYVKDQLSFFFDAGWPAHFPLTPQQNASAYWNYRVYSAYPVAVYDEQDKQIEDNRSDWHSLVDRMEYPTPLGVHLLEDPSQVDGATAGVNLVLRAPSLSDIRDNARWKDGLGTGIHNVSVAYSSDGPIIDTFESLNHYRTTLGNRDVPGSYRYRMLLRAHSSAPLALVEVWGGGQLIRRYRPGTASFQITFDDEQARQRGMLLRVVDTKGREALATSIMVHDKMMVWYWCGDHCNALPYGQGVDEQGNPTGLGLVTHVKGAYTPAGGPGGTFIEAWEYVPSGTDTSFPGLNLSGGLRLLSDAGQVPGSNVNLLSDNHFWYANRDVLITRMDVDSCCPLDKYVPQEQPTINGWYPYVTPEPTEDFDLTHDDLDLHRDAGQPSLQLCRGEVRFKRDVTLSDKDPLNVVIIDVGWNTIKQGVYSVQGKLAQPGRIAGKLGRGNWVTWPAELGDATVFALDNDFAVNVAVNKDGTQNGRPALGYALGQRTFHAGDVYRYSFLLMRWPVGARMEDRLDAKLATALNLAAPGGARSGGVQMTATRGRVVSDQVTLDLEAKTGAFVGTLKPLNVGMRVPVRVTGLNPNWTIAAWRPGMTQLMPFGVDPAGWAWTSLDPVSDAGQVFLGNVVLCSDPGLIVRVLQRTGGGWDVVVNNPLDHPVHFTVKPMPGGPITGHWAWSGLLAPGEESKTVR